MGGPFTNEAGSANPATNTFHDSGHEYQRSQVVGSKSCATEPGNKPEMAILISRFEAILDAVAGNSARLKESANQLVGITPEMADERAKNPAYSALTKLENLISRLADINSELDDTAARFSRAL